MEVVKKQWVNSGNLKPWKPGQSGNPAGRPTKEACITSLVKQYLETKDKHGQTYAQLVAEAMVKGALKDPQILRELLNRCEGKVKDEIELETRSVSILYQLVKGRDDAIEQRGSEEDTSEGGEDG